MRGRSSSHGPDGPDGRPEPGACRTVDQYTYCTQAAEHTATESKRQEHQQHITAAHTSHTALHGCLMRTPYTLWPRALTHLKRLRALLAAPEGRGSHAPSAHTRQLHPQRLHPQQQAASAASHRPRSRFRPAFFASPIVLPIESTISRHLSVGGEGSEKLDVHRKAHECCVPRAGQVRQVRARRAPLESFAQHARVGTRRPRARFWPEVTGPLSRGARTRDRHAWALPWAPKIYG